MSECVVRMEKPERCVACGVRMVCPVYRAFLQVCATGAEPPTVGQNGCVFICSLPEGHGRLVDADPLINQWETVPDKLAAGAGENKWVADMVMGIQGHFIEGIIKSLENAPTIVPAEAERKVDASDAVTPTNTPTDTPTVPAERSEA